MALATSTTHVADEASPREEPWLGESTSHQGQPYALAPGLVKVGGEIGRRIDVTQKNNLLVLDVDKDFLKPLRERKLRPGAYLGLGKLIDATVYFACFSGDERVLTFKRRLVAEVLKTQENDGYLGYFKAESRVWSLCEIMDMAYIVYRLTMDYRFFGEAASLEGARKLADFVIARWSAEPQRAIGGDLSMYHSLQVAATGIENAMLALYQQTQDAKHLAFVRDFLKIRDWDGQIVLGRWGKLEGHAYTRLAQCVAQLRLHRLEPEPRLLTATYDLLRFLLHGDSMTITGACGDYECWHNTQAGTITLGETCATRYAFLWFDELMRLEGNSLYGDLMERPILNTLFGAQSPEGRRIRYWTSFDGPRECIPTDTFCCPNNYRRAIAVLPDLIYYRVDGGLAVNLFTASSAEVALDNDVTVKLRQETDIRAPARWHSLWILPVPRASRSGCASPRGALRRTSWLTGSRAGKRRRRANFSWSVASGSRAAKCGWTCR